MAEPTATAEQARASYMRALLLPAVFVLMATSLPGTSAESPVTIDLSTAQSGDIVLVGDTTSSGCSFPAVIFLVNLENATTYSPYRNYEVAVTQDCKYQVTDVCTSLLLCPDYYEPEVTVADGTSSLMSTCTHSAKVRSSIWTQGYGGRVSEDTDRLSYVSIQATILYFCSDGYADYTSAGATCDHSSLYWHEYDCTFYDPQLVGTEDGKGYAGKFYCTSPNPFCLETDYRHQLKAESKITNGGTERCAYAFTPLDEAQPPYKRIACAIS